MSRGDEPSATVLVVDDDPDIARLIEINLRLEGFDVRVAHDGEQAEQSIDEETPDLVLLDIGLPGMDGYEVARQLRVMTQFSGTLIVALTGWGQEADVERSREAGFDHHLVKPASPEAILELLTKAGAGEP